MILTGDAIQAAIEGGEIEISPPSMIHIQPNGIDFHLDRTLIELEGPLDMKCAPAGRTFEIPEDGYVLQPGSLYLGLTIQKVASSHYAQWLYGDRTIGSMGIFTQVSAPLGHVGSAIRWTLEIVVVKPVRVYSGMKFGKICFLVNQGPIIEYGAAVLGQSKYTTDQLTLSRLESEGTVDESHEPPQRH